MVAGDDDGGWARGAGTKLKGCSNRQHGRAFPSWPSPASRCWLRSGPVSSVWVGSGPDLACCPPGNTAPSSSPVSSAPSSALNGPLPCGRTRHTPGRERRRPPMTPASTTWRPSSPEWGAWPSCSVSRPCWGALPSPSARSRSPCSSSLSTASSPTSPMAQWPAARWPGWSATFSGSPAGRCRTRYRGGPLSSS